jgi:hypothetical protein
MIMKDEPRICAIVVMVILAAGPWMLAATATAQLTAPQPQRREKAIGLLNQAIEIAHSEPDPK